MKTLSSRSRVFSLDTVLPSLAEVRAEAIRQSPQGISRFAPPVYFHGLNLVVKYGQKNTMGGGHCIWLIKCYLKDQVPVPEVYAWKRDGHEFFLQYMQLVAGVTLRNCWNDLPPTHKDSIYQDRRQVIRGLRSLRQNSTQVFVGQCIH
jgi:hypothetical protein